MVKIESISDDVVAATIKRGNDEVMLFKGQIIHMHDLASLKVVGGTLEYSIDELELVKVDGLPVFNTNAKVTVVTAPATASEKPTVVTAPATASEKPTVSVAKAKVDD